LPTKRNPLEIEQTNDQSHTVVSSEYGEMYHSRFGAYTESDHVFIRKGLYDILDSNKNAVNIFEMGFGTGLNAFLTAMVANKSQTTIKYFTVEQIPLEKELWSQLNYADFVAQEYSPLFDKLHAAPWNEWQIIDPHFELYKALGKLEALDWSNLKNIDLIYYDAFAPNAQPELWEADVFEKIFGILTIGGLLCTYCAKGQVKRNLKAAGFEVESIPGPPGKREMTRAWKR